MDYREVAEIANRRRRDALAAEPLLSDDKLRSYTKDLTTLSRDADVFSQLEITIINAEAADIVVKIGEGSWTSLQVTIAFCKAASIAQQLTNCLTEVLFAEARERAQVLDEYLAKTGKTIGPLHGLPISLKDCFITPPHPSSIGIAAFANGNSKPDEESAMAILLRSLGAVFYVKSNTPVAMMMMETDNNVWGPSCNPYNRELSPGGSSGGEGALLALRASPLGIGTDIGGSVRIPSAWCNLYGLRPSFGRFPTFGTRSGIPGQEVVMSVNGPMARSLETLKFYSSTVLSPAAAPWKLDPKCVPMPWSSKTQIQPAGRKLRLAVIGNNDGVVTVHPPVERAIDMTKKALEAAGHDVVDWDLSLHVSLFKSMGAAFLDFGGTAIMPLLEAHDEPVFPSMQAYALAAEAAASGGPILTPDKQRDNNAAKWKLQKAHMDAWNAAGIDGIVMAVTPWAAARLGFTIGSQKTHYVGYTGWVNVLDLPSCTFPVTFADKAKDPKRIDFEAMNESDQAIQEDYDPDFYDGAPVALQLVGERLQEEKVLEMVGMVRDGLVALDGSKR